MPNPEFGLTGGFIQMVNKKQYDSNGYSKKW